MRSRKRLKKIETSLTPTQAVLLQLKEMFELGREKFYNEKLSGGPSPRVVVLRMVADAIRENLTEPGLKPDQVELAVREGQKQADMRMILVLKLHDYVRTKLAPAGLYSRLSTEKLERLCEHYNRNCDAESLDSLPALSPESWNSWAELLEERLIQICSLKEMVLLISEQYFECHPLLFPADEDNLNSEIAQREEMAADFNDFCRMCPKLREINVDAYLSSTREHLEELVSIFADNAKAQTLIDFGEEEEARQLLHSSKYRALRALERRRLSILAAAQHDVTS